MWSMKSEWENSEIHKFQKPKLSSNYLFFLSMSSKLKDVQFTVWLSDKEKL